MVLSEEDRILIKNLYYFKGYGTKRLISEFPSKGWKKTTVNDFLKRLKETGSTIQKLGKNSSNSGEYQRSQCFVHQEDAPQTHCTTRQIARETGIHRSSVV